MTYDPEKTPQFPVTVMQAVFRETCQTGFGRPERDWEKAPAWKNCEHGDSGSDGVATTLTQEHTMMIHQVWKQHNAQPKMVADRFEEDGV